MKKPYPKSERCTKCKRICAGNFSTPNSWYCDYCKAVFGKLINKESTTTGYLELEEKWYSK